jgi:hypothetical protein
MSKTAAAGLSLLVLLWACMALWLGFRVHAAGEAALAIATVIIAVTPLVLAALLLRGLLRALRRRSV